MNNNEITIQNGLNEVRHLFSHVRLLESKDDGNTRVRIVFKSGVEISCVRGEHAYADKGTMELAVIGTNGRIDYTLTDGDVLCYQKLEDLIDLIKKVYKHYENPVST